MDDNNTAMDSGIRAAVIGLLAGVRQDPVGGQWRRALSDGGTDQERIDIEAYADIGYKLGAARYQPTDASGLFVDEPDDAPDDVPLPERDASPPPHVKAPHGRQLVPYGKHVFTAVRNGWRPSNGLWLYCGDGCYGFAKQDNALYPNERGALALPDDIDLDALWWPHLAELDVMLVPGAPLANERLQVLAEQLLVASCGRLTVVGGEAL